MSNANYNAAAPSNEQATQIPVLPPLREATLLWLEIGCLSFGGPAGQIALLHRKVVDDRRWVSDRRFLHALNFCHLLPGPEAQQLAIYLGWLMHGALGGLIAGLLFVIPGALVMLALSLIYAIFGTVPLVASIFYGLKCAVLLLVVEAMLRIGRRALKGPAAWTLAGLSFVALFFFGLPFPVVVLAAGLLGGIAPDAFAGTTHATVKNEPPARLDAVLAVDPDRAKRLSRGARRAGLVCAILWLLPVVALLPIGGVYADVAWFFSKMAVVTFGGAYAVLAYAGQEAVQNYHWLSPQEMLSGLGLAETTPGPLILVLQFIGFLAGFRAPGAFSDLAGGVTAALLTLWVTFLPCFAFVFLGAPLIEQLQGNRKLSGALSAVTAAVVGVVANLAIWFALHVLFRQATTVQGWGASFDAPVVGSIDFKALGLAVLAGVALFKFKVGVVPTLAVCAAVSVVVSLASNVV